MAFSIALLSNKTKLKINSLKTRLAIMENQVVFWSWYNEQTDLLFELYKEQSESIQELEKSLNALQTGMVEIYASTRSAKTWTTFGIAGMVVFIWIYRHQRQEQKLRELGNQKRILSLSARIHTLEKLVHKPSSIPSVKKEPVSEPTQKKKQKKKNHQFYVLYG